MTAPRRFTDDEVALILERAAQDTVEPGSDDPTSSALTTSPGMSLEELQTIAREAGIDPRAVARVADSVVRGDLVPTAVQRATGAPIALARTVHFGREVDDRSWARMVILLQETFAARGKLRSDGALREWSNGNLRAVLEPTAQGHQLRISTRKGDAAVLRAVGNATIALSVVLAGAMLTVNAVQGAPPPDGLPWLSVLLPGFMGIGARLQDILSRRAWGREREAQLTALPAKLRALLLESGQ